MRSPRNSSPNNSKKSDAPTRGGKARPLSTEELDQIAGGVGKTTSSTTPVSSSVGAAWNAVAGFNTSNIALDAASMQSGKTEAELAQAVGTGQATEAQAVHLLEQVALVDSTSVTRALAVFAGDLVGEPGHAGAAYLVGGQIGGLIAAGTVSAPQAMADIGAAVTSGELNANNAVSVLAGIAGNGTASVQGAAGGEVGQLIENSNITVAQALADINSLVSEDGIAPTNAVGLLAGVANNSNASVQAAAGGDIAQLIENGNITAAQALGQIDSVVGSGGIAPANAVGLLAGVAETGNQSLQIAVGGEIATLVSSGQLTAAQATGGVDWAVTTGELNGNNAITVLASMAENGNAGVQAEAGASIVEIAYKIGAAQALGDIGSLVGSGVIAPYIGVFLLAAFGSNSGTSGALAAGGELAAMLQSGQLTEPAMLNYLDAAMLSNIAASADLVVVMDGMAANGNAQAQVAAGSVLAWMIQHGSITLDQALSDMLSFLNSGSLAPANAIGLLVGMSAAGNQSLQYTVGVELVQLILDGNVTAQQAASDFGAAVKSGELSANNAVTVLVGMYLMGMNEGDNPAVQGAAAGEIAQLIASGAIDPPQAFGVINNLITATISPALTVSDVINLYVSMAANGNASVQATAGGGIAQLIENGSTNAPDALDSIDDLVSEGAIATANAVALFAAIASAGNAPLQVAAGYQIGQMIEDSTITSQQAFGDISSLVNAGSLAPGNAVGLLEGVAVAGNQSLQIAAGGEIATLVNAGQLTKQQAQTDIANAVGAGLMTAAQAQAILQGLG